MMLEVNIAGDFTASRRGESDLERLEKRFQHRDTGWTTPEAFLGVLFKAAMVDGQVDSIEEKTITNIIDRSRALQTIPKEQLPATIRTVNDRLNSRQNALEEACSTLPAEMCMSVFAHCVDIVLADGFLHDAEAKFLDKIAPLLDIDEHNMRRVMEVLFLKASY